MAGKWKESRRRRSVALVVALLAGWILVVVVGGGNEPQTDPLLGVEGIGIVMFGVLVFTAFIGLLLFIYLWPRGDDDRPPPKRDKKRGFMGVVAVCLLLMLWRPDVIGTLQPIEPEDNGTFTPAEDLIGRAAQPPAESVAQLTDLLLVALAIAAVGGLWFLARRRALPAEQPFVVEGDDQLEAELLVAIDDATAELAMGTDPRSAVLGAYASLERALASQDNPRRASETPTEHLRRALANLRVDPEPLVHLGALYQLARFSDQDITTTQRDQARDALQQSREELAALTWTAR